MPRLRFSALSAAPSVILLGALGLGCAETTPDPKSAIAVTEVDLAPKKPTPDPALTREEALEQARNAGILGLISQSGSMEGVFGASAFDADLDAALGGLMGSEVGEAYGAGGLGLVGTGRGGGGSGEGTIGLGNIGVIGKGGGGTGQGFGSGSGRLGRGPAPQLKAPGHEVIGSLPKEVIQRVVRQNFGRFRLCYEQGLLKNPKLAGRVTTKFTIAPNGAVSVATSTSSDLADASVTSCVQKAFQSMTFPEPDKGGVVVVNYPIAFSPGDDGGSAATTTAVPAPEERKLGGKRLSEAGASELEKALGDAGYTSVSRSDHPSIKGASLVSAEKAKQRFVVLVVPANAKISALPSEDQLRIASGAGIQREGFSLSISGPDQASARALLDAVLVDKK